MGILNLTPDSFSDGGEYLQIESALKRAKEMASEGADYLDLGAESTGPGSIDVSTEEELKRLIPILKAIRKEVKIPISIDTTKAAVADAALNAGANLINDISALRADPDMAATIAKHHCPLILMYSKDPTPRTTKSAKTYDDVIATISDFFTERISYAKEKGIKEIILDPGMGHYISALPQYSYEIIARLAELKKFDKELLIGLSRKSFLGGPLTERDEKGLPLTAIAYLNGASIIRTHNVKATKELCQQWN